MLVIRGFGQTRAPISTFVPVWNCVQLEHEGHKCTSISGELELSARDRVVNEFREGKTRILIATDVLSRGFDVQQVMLQTFHLFVCLPELNYWTCQLKMIKSD